ncbi:hypothetical protein AVEN_132704-1 [Araneus ventricosus]|uniref:Uncharacterized protein n=1 Tax=Araneus ventricosus TaxID=182803 RepID=A0A4Y2AWB9_ARAVE|nr:hypothetical protein AVEN_132704-1 [Araneus ventricosus]
MVIPLLSSPWTVRDSNNNSTCPSTGLGDPKSKAQTEKKDPPGFLAERYSSIEQGWARALRLKRGEGKKEINPKIHGDLFSSAIWTLVNRLQGRALLVS